MRNCLNVQAHHLSISDVLSLAETMEHGLTTPEVEKRLVQFGANSLPAPKRRGAWLRFALQFHNPLIYVLMASGVITFLLKDYVDTGVIFAVILINALIGFVQEGKAEKALEAVRSMLASHAKVLRDGVQRQIDAVNLVPGDIVLLESGDKVPADLRLLRVKNLHIMEAALTGESVPVEKSIQTVPENATIGDRTCMAYSGTLVSFGHAQGVVVATGQQSEIGKIGTLMSEVQTLATPLTRRLDSFARQITAFILIVSALTFAYGHWVMHMPRLDIFLAVVGLAVAAIPEGLPAVVTIVLAIGTRIMAHNRAIVRRLPAVETLGSVTVICSDKTGTLTCNEMTAVRVMLPTHTLQVTGAGYVPDGQFTQESIGISAADDRALQSLSICALLCNDAQLKHEADLWRMVGDPTEGALLTLAYKAELDAQEMAKRYPRLDEIPFESEHRYMATLHHDHAGGVFILLKGAPERVLDLCVQDASGQAFDKTVWQTRVNKAASHGERVLALARCDMPTGTTALNMTDITPRFTLLGLVGMIDPPRTEAIAAVAECQSAGLRVMMITGDHVVTATAIAKQLGLSAEYALTGEVIETLSDAELKSRLQTVNVIARASPQHKLRLVSALQAEGELVAMTGDGVNDAPAIKAADIGVAMGNKGTDAAREAADLVLTDDNFATIARAVREGRVVLDNIKKALLFMLPTNGGEAGVILLAVFAGIALPVTAGQILWINMITAVTLALAIAFEPAEAGIMQRKPRPPTEPLITKVLMMRIVYVSVLMIAVAFGIFEWELARGNSIDLARTSAVNMLVMGELVYLFNVRYFTASSLRTNIFTGNKVTLWVSMALIGFQLLFTYAPPMQQLFASVALDWVSWAMIITLALLKFLAVEVEKAVWRYLKVTMV